MDSCISLYSTLQPISNVYKTDKELFRIVSLAALPHIFTMPKLLIFLLWEWILSLFTILYVSENNLSLLPTRPTFFFLYMPYQLPIPHDLCPFFQKVFSESFQKKYFWAFNISSCNCTFIIVILMTWKTSLPHPQAPLTHPYYPSTEGILFFWIKIQK